MLTLRNMKIIFNYACLSGGLVPLDYEHLSVPVKAAYSETMNIFRKILFSF